MTGCGNAPSCRVPLFPGYFFRFSLETPAGAKIPFYHPCLQADCDSSSRWVVTLTRAARCLPRNVLPAHFITQKYLYTNLPIPLSIDYVLLDLRDSWQEQADVRWLYELRNVQRQVEARPNLHLVDVEDGLLLYARQGTPLDARAVVEYGVLPAGTARQNLSLGYGIRVAAISILPKPGAGRTPTCPIRLTTFSTVDARTNVDISARCILQFGGKGTEIEHYASKFQPLGQGIWPIERWETGRFYADDFLISVPAELSNQSFTITFNTAALNP